MNTRLGAHPVHVQNMHNFIHIEASGLGAGSYPIEIGVALASGDRRCTLVCPPVDWVHWDAGAERAPSLARDNLLLSGRSVLKVALLLNEWLGDETVYSNAWGNDVVWLEALFRRAGVQQRCTVETVNVLLHSAEPLAWQLASARLAAQDPTVRWRASNQAQRLQEAVQMLGNAGMPVQAAF
ncbi:MAG: hypothetical protein HKO07_02615 [Pseudomonadales bacterium]|nr:hypothetical protein [Pseudomonadales bacterium]